MVKTSEMSMELKQELAFTKEELAELEAAKKMPITFDADCPETTPERAVKFRRVNPPRNRMSKIMNGARAINAIELHKISEYLHVSMDSLMKMPEKPMDTNVIHAFMGRVKTEEARKGIQLADELSDMILFHTRVCENGKKMEQPWEDK